MQALALLVAPTAAVTLVGETSLADLKTRPNFSVTVNNALVGFIEVKGPGKGADPRRYKGHDKAGADHSGEQNNHVTRRAVPKDRYEIEGRAWLPIARAARLLGTNAQGIRKLMGDGTLDWRQSRANSRTLLVEEQAVLKLRSARPSPKLKRSPDPLASQPKRVDRAEMEVGTMNPLRGRLRNQLEIIPPAPDGGAPGRRRPGK